MERGCDSVARNMLKLFTQPFVRIAYLGNPAGLTFDQRGFEQLVDLGAVGQVGRAKLGGGNLERAFGGPPIAGNRSQPGLVLNQPDQTRHRLGAIGVETAQRAIANRRVADRGIDHIGQSHVAREGIGPIDLAGQIEPGITHRCAGRKFCTAFLRGQRARDGGAWCFVLHGLVNQLGKSQAALVVDNKAVLRVAFFPRDVPAIGSRHRQHSPRTGRRDPRGAFMRGQRRALGGDHKGITFSKAAGEQAIGV